MAMYEFMRTMCLSFIMASDDDTVQSKTLPLFIALGIVVSLD